MSSFQPAVVVNWSGAIDGWFRPLLQGERLTVPVATDEQWQEWLRAAHSHGLLPLLSYWLPPAGLGAKLPLFVQTHLQQAYTVAMTEATCRWFELKKLVGALGEAGVRPLVLKGTALAEICYPRPELRPSSDIDLLVRPEEYQVARQALMAQGYRLTSGDRSEQMAWNNQEVFVFGNGDETRQYAVELHWSLSPYTRVRQNLPVNLLFEQAIVLNGGGGEEAGGIQALCPADALAYAALHLIYKHYLYDPASVRLIWLYDVDLLARQIQGEAGWHAVLASSQRLEARLALLDTLSLAQAWFGSPIPAAVADLNHYPPSALERQLHDFPLSDPSRRFKLHSLRLSGLSGREKLRYISDRLFPDRRDLVGSYPQLGSVPLPLAYLARLYLSFRRKRVS